MKRQGTALWLMAFGILGLFIIATVTAPGPLDSLRNPAGDNGSGSNNTSTAMIFKAPTLSSGVDDIDEGGAVNLTLKASPVSGQTSSGGTWAWLFMFEGVSGKSDQFVIRYNNGTVAWFPAGSGAIKGLGERFSQGPGAVSVDIETDISLAIGTPGDYTLKCWIVEAENLVTLDPTNLKARSGELTVDITVNEKLEPSVSVSQTLSKLSGEVVRRTAAEFLLNDHGVARDKWTGEITDQIIVEKTGIRVGDIISATWSSGSSSGRIVWTDRGNYLIGSLGTMDPFEGEETTETADWSTTIDITFGTPGDYTLRADAVDDDTSESVSSGASIEVVVQLRLSSPEDTSTGDATNNTTAPAPAPEPSEPAPGDNTSGTGDGTDDGSDGGSDGSDDGAPPDNGTDDNTTTGGSG